MCEEGENEEGSLLWGPVPARLSRWVVAARIWWENWEPCGWVSRAGRLRTGSSRDRSGGRESGQASLRGLGFRVLKLP